MFVYTMSKKRVVRVGLLVLTLIVGIAIGVAAILTSINVDAREPKLPIYSVDRTDNKIAVTFDCAWGNSNTDELLDILKEHNVRATFFVTGEFCDKYPDDVRKFSDAGHEIANHSDKHPHVEGININTLIADTNECGRKIEMIVGKKPTLYRSPYGEYDDNLITTIEGMGYKPIQWSVDSIDWKEPSPETMTKRVVDSVVSGSILLFHNDLQNTTEALPTILTQLTQKGFTFSPVSEMIYYKDFHIDHSGKQIFDVNVNVEMFSAGEKPTELEQAIAILAANFSSEEIAQMSDGISTESALKLTRLLTQEQLAAFTSLTSEQAMAILTSALPTEPVEIVEEEVIEEHVQNDDDVLLEDEAEIEMDNAIGGEDIIAQINGNSTEVISK